MPRKVYSVRVDQTVIEYISDLPKKVQRQIIKKIDSLANNPRPQNIKPIKGADGFYRVRSGDYRIIYSVDDKKVYVYVVAMGDRKSVYAMLKRKKWLGL